MTPTFIGGPKDGGKVPDMLWILYKVELTQQLENGHYMIYYYKVDDDSKNYIYQGQKEVDVEEEDGHGF